MDLRLVKPHLKWSASLFVTGMTLGCGNYTSDYLPPRDGRARAVWQEDRVVAVLPEERTTACNEAVFEVKQEPARYRTYYGGSSNIILWRPWVIVTSSRGSRMGAGSNSPVTARMPATPSISGGGRGGSGSGIGSIGTGGGSSGGGGGGGGDVGKAALVLVVVAMLTLPLITLGLGLGRPEPSEEVAVEIDKVNAYNDLARLSDSPCAAGAGAQ